MIIWILVNGERGAEKQARIQAKKEYNKIKEKDKDKDVKIYEIRVRLRSNKILYYGYHYLSGMLWRLQDYSNSIDHLVYDYESITMKDIQNALNNEYEYRPLLIIGSGSITQFLCSQLTIYFNNDICKDDDKTKNIQIQTPRWVANHYFDQIMAPEHDYYEQKRPLSQNLTLTFGSIHEIDVDFVNDQLRYWSSKVRERNKIGERKIMSILIGSPIKNCKWNPMELVQFIQSLIKSSSSSYFYWISVSRRTPKWFTSYLIQETKDYNQVQIYNPHKESLLDENPYYGFLSLSSEILCTGDSVSMITEIIAISTITNAKIYYFASLLSHKHLYFITLAEQKYFLRHYKEIH